MRLIGIIIGTLFFIVIGFATVHFWGLSQRFAPFSAEFWKISEKIWIAPWEQNFILEKSPNWVLWVDVYRNQNQDLLAKPWTERNLPNKKLEQTPSPTRPLLKELLEKFPSSRFVLNITDNLENIHLQTVKTIEEAQAENRVIIQSDYNVVLQSIKDLKALLVFGCTQADLMRFKAFDSMWILSAVPFKGDVFISPLKLKNLPAYNSNILAEMRRRNKKIIIGPVRAAELSSVLNEKPDGILVEDPLVVLKDNLQL